MEYGITFGDMQVFAGKCGLVHDVRALHAHESACGEGLVADGGDVSGATILVCTSRECYALLDVQNDRAEPSTSGGITHKVATWVDINCARERRRRAESFGGKSSNREVLVAPRETRSETGVSQPSALGPRRQREWHPVEGVTKTREENDIRVSMHMEGRCPVVERRMRATAGAIVPVRVRRWHAFHTQAEGVEGCEPGRNRNTDQV